MDAVEDSKRTTVVGEQTINPSERRRRLPKESFCEFDIVENYQKQKRSRRSRDRKVSSDLVKKIKDVAARNAEIEQIYCSQISDTSNPQVKEIKEYCGYQNSEKVTTVRERKHRSRRTTSVYSNEKLRDQLKTKSDKELSDEISKVLSIKVSLEKELHRRRSRSDCCSNRKCGKSPSEEFKGVKGKRNETIRDSSLDVCTKAFGQRTKDVTICQNCSGHIHEGYQNLSSSKRKSKKPTVEELPAESQNVITVYENTNASDQSESIVSKGFKDYIKKVKTKSTKNERSLKGKGCNRNIIEDGSNKIVGDQRNDDQIKLSENQTKRQKAEDIQSAEKQGKADPKRCVNEEIQNEIKCETDDTASDSLSYDKQAKTAQKLLEPSVELQRKESKTGKVQNNETRNTSVHPKILQQDVLRFTAERNGKVDLKSEIQTIYKVKEKQNRMEQKGEKRSKMDLKDCHGNETLCNEKPIKKIDQKDWHKDETQCKEKVKQKVVGPKINVEETKASRIDQKLLEPSRYVDQTQNNVENRNKKNVPAISSVSNLELKRKGSKTNRPNCNYEIELQIPHSSTNLENNAEKTKDDYETKTNNTLRKLIELYRKEYEKNAVEHKQKHRSRSKRNTSISSRKNDEINVTDSTKINRRELSFSKLNLTPLRGQYSNLEQAYTETAVVKNDDSKTQTKKPRSSEENNSSRIKSEEKKLRRHSEERVVSRIKNEVKLLENDNTRIKSGSRQHSENGRGKFKNQEFCSSRIKSELTEGNTLKKLEETSTRIKESDCAKLKNQEEYGSRIRNALESDGFKFKNVEGNYSSRIKNASKERLEIDGSKTKNSEEHCDSRIKNTPNENDASKTKNLEEIYCSKLKKALENGGFKFENPEERYGSSSNTELQHLDELKSKNVEHFCAKIKNNPTCLEKDVLKSKNLEEHCGSRTKCNSRERPKNDLKLKNSDEHYGSRSNNELQLGVESDNLKPKNQENYNSTSNSEPQSVQSDGLRLKNAEEHYGSRIKNEKEQRPGVKSKNQEVYSSRIKSESTQENTAKNLEEHGFNFKYLQNYYSLRKRYENEIAKSKNTEERYGSRSKNESNLRVENSTLKNPDGSRQRLDNEGSRYKNLEVHCGSGTKNEQLDNEDLISKERCCTRRRSKSDCFGSKNQEEHCGTRIKNQHDAVDFKDIEQVIEKHSRTKHEDNEEKHQESKSETTNLEQSSSDYGSTISSEAKNHGSEENDSLRINHDLKNLQQSNDAKKPENDTQESKTSEYPDEIMKLQQWLEEMQDSRVKSGNRQRPKKNDGFKTNRENVQHSTRDDMTLALQDIYTTVESERTNCMSKNSFRSTKKCKNNAVVLSDIITEHEIAEMKGKSEKHNNLTKKNTFHTSKTVQNERIVEISSKVFGEQTISFTVEGIEPPRRLGNLRKVLKKTLNLSTKVFKSIEVSVDDVRLMNHGTYRLIESEIDSIDSLETNVRTLFVNDGSHSRYSGEDKSLYTSPHQLNLRKGTCDEKSSMFEIFNNKCFVIQNVECPQRYSTDSSTQTLHKDVCTLRKDVQERGALNNFSTQISTEKKKDAATEVDNYSEICPSCSDKNGGRHYDCSECCFLNYMMTFGDVTSNDNVQIFSSSKSENNILARKGGSLNEQTSRNLFQKINRSGKKSFVNLGRSKSFITTNFDKTSNNDQKNTCVRNWFNQKSSMVVNCFTKKSSDQYITQKSSCSNLKSSVIYITEESSDILKYTNQEQSVKNRTNETSSFESCGKCSIIETTKSYEQTNAIINEKKAYTEELTVFEMDKKTMCCEESRAYTIHQKNTCGEEPKAFRIHQKNTFCEAPVEVSKNKFTTKLIDDLRLKIRSNKLRHKFWKKSSDDDDVKSWVSKNKLRNTKFNESTKMKGDELKNLQGSLLDEANLSNLEEQKCDCGNLSEDLKDQIFNSNEYKSRELINQDVKESNVKNGSSIVFNGSTLILDKIRSKQDQTGNSNDLNEYLQKISTTKCKFLDNDPIVNTQDQFSLSEYLKDLIATLDEASKDLTINKHDQSSFGEILKEVSIKKHIRNDSETTLIANKPNQSSLSEDLKHKNGRSSLLTCHQSSLNRYLKDLGVSKTDRNNFIEDLKKYDRCSLKNNLKEHDRSNLIKSIKELNAKSGGGSSLCKNLNGLSAKKPEILALEKCFNEILLQLYHEKKIFKNESEEISTGEVEFIRRSRLHRRRHRKRFNYMKISHKKSSNSSPYTEHNSMHRTKSNYLAIRKKKDKRSTKFSECGHISLRNNVLSTQIVFKCNGQFVSSGTSLSSRQSEMTAYPKSTPSLQLGIPIHRYLNFSSSLDLNHRKCSNSILKNKNKLSSKDVKRQAKNFMSAGVCDEDFFAKVSSVSCVGSKNVSERKDKLFVGTSHIEKIPGVCERNVWKLSLENPEVQYASKFTYNLQGSNAEKTTNRKIGKTCNEKKIPTIRKSRIPKPLVKARNKKALVKALVKDVKNVSVNDDSTPVKQAKFLSFVKLQASKSEEDSAKKNITDDSINMTKTCEQMPRDSGIISKEPFFINSEVECARTRSNTSVDSLEVLPYDPEVLCPLTAFFNFSPPTYAYHVYHTMTRTQQGDDEKEEASSERSTTNRREENVTTSGIEEISCRTSCKSDEEKKNVHEKFTSCSCEQQKEEENKDFVSLSRSSCSKASSSTWNNVTNLGVDGAKDERGNANATNWGYDPSKEDKSVVNKDSGNWGYLSANENKDYTFVEEAPTTSTTKIFPKVDHNRSKIFEDNAGVTNTNGSNKSFVKSSHQQEAKENKVFSTNKNSDYPKEIQDFFASMEDSVMSATKRHFTTKNGEDNVNQKLVSDQSAEDDYQSEDCGSFALNNVDRKGKNDDSKWKNEDPKWKIDDPKSKSVGPKWKNDDTKTKDNYSKGANDDYSKTKIDDPERKNDDPKTKINDQKGKDVDPNWKNDDPRTNKDDSKSKNGIEKDDDESDSGVFDINKGIASWSFKYVKDNKDNAICDLNSYDYSKEEKHSTTSVENKKHVSSGYSGLKKLEDCKISDTNNDNTNQSSNQPCGIKNKDIVGANKDNASIDYDYSGESFGENKPNISWGYNQSKEMEHNEPSVVDGSGYNRLKFTEDNKATGMITWGTRPKKVEDTEVSSVNGWGNKQKGNETSDTNGWGSRSKEGNSTMSSWGYNYLKETKNNKMSDVNAQIESNRLLDIENVEVSGASGWGCGLKNEEENETSDKIGWGSRPKEDNSTMCSWGYNYSNETKNNKMCDVNGPIESNRLVQIENNIEVSDGSNWGYGLKNVEENETSDINSWGNKPKEGSSNMRSWGYNYPQEMKNTSDVNGRPKEMANFADYNCNGRACPKEKEDNATLDAKTDVSCLNRERENVNPGTKRNDQSKENAFSSTCKNFWVWTYHQGKQKDNSSPKKKLTTWANNLLPKKQESLLINFYNQHKGNEDKSKFTSFDDGHSADVQEIEEKKTFTTWAKTNEREETLISYATTPKVYQEVPVPKGKLKASLSPKLVRPTFFQKGKSTFSEMKPSSCVDKNNACININYVEENDVCNDSIIDLLADSSKISPSGFDVSNCSSWARDILESPESGYESARPPRMPLMRNFFKKRGSLLDVFRRSPGKKCADLQARNNDDSSDTLQDVDNKISSDSQSSEDSGSVGKTVLWFHCKKKKAESCGKSWTARFGHVSKDGDPKDGDPKDSKPKDKSMRHMEHQSKSTSTRKLFRPRKCCCMTDTDKQMNECKKYAEKVLLEAAMRKEGYFRQYKDFKEIPLEQLIGKRVHAPAGHSRKLSRSMEVQTGEMEGEVTKAPIKEKEQKEKEQKKKEEGEVEEEEDLELSIPELPMDSMDDALRREALTSMKSKKLSSVLSLELLEFTSKSIVEEASVEKSKSTSEESGGGSTSRKERSHDSVVEKKITDKEVFDKLLDQYDKNDSIAERLSKDEEFFQEQLSTARSTDSANTQLSKQDSRLSNASKVVSEESGAVENDNKENESATKMRGPRFSDKPVPQSGKSDCTVKADDIGTCFARGFRPDNMMLSGDACFNLNKQDKIKMSPHMLKNTESIIDFSERETPLDFLLALGFMVDEASNALKDDDIRSRLLAAITEARVWINKITTTQGTLLYLVAYKSRPDTMRYFLQLVEAIINKRITNAIKLDGFLRVLEQVEDGRLQMISILGEDKFEDEENEEKIIKKQLKHLFVNVHSIAQAEAAQQKKELLPSQIMLLRNLVAKYRAGLHPHLQLIARYIGQGLLDTDIQLEAAMIFLSRLDTAEVKLKEFENYCGINCDVVDEKKKKKTKLME